MKSFLFILVCFSISTGINKLTAQARERSGKPDILLPKMFSDGMVLQRDQQITVWGWSAPGEKVIIQLKKQVGKATADKNGKWLVKLAQEPAGGPFTLTVKGNTSITIHDVLIGDVWICSGQSNMEFPVALALNAQKEMKEADYPYIRQFAVPKTVNLQPADTLKSGSWKICNSANVRNFTAIGYFFAKNLYNELKVPIGLINATIGGTNIETWISKKAFEEDDLFREMIKQIPTLGIEELSRHRMEIIKKKIDSVQANPLPVTALKDVTELSFDDSNWPLMSLPGLWETRGWPEIDGKLWFRKDVIIDASDTGKTAVMELGNIDDSDDSYINGIKVGSTKNKPADDRKYNIPRGVLRCGKNTIAILIEDTGGGGGFGGLAVKMKITLENTTIPLAGSWHYKIDTVYSSGFAVYPNSYPTLLFNAMIYPLIPYSIKGVIWYQGESNTSRAFQYRTTFPLMIKDWRSQWKQGDFPFLYVQLASFNAAPENIKKGSTWAELREAQSLALNIPNTGMAVTIDIGDANDIHPKNKQEAAKRLAAVALNKVYRKRVVYNGPSLLSMKSQGNKVILSFKNADNGFLIKDSSAHLKGFIIAGDDKQFRNAKAYINGNSIVVYHDEIKMPVAVRYAWADNAGDANLFNKEGLPAAPFRTDSWDVITMKEVYRIGR